MRLEVWCWGWWWWWWCCEGVTPVAAMGGGTKCTDEFFFLLARKYMLEPVVSPSRDFIGQKCNQATERGSTYARISAENFMTFKKRNLYPDTKEPACVRLLVLSFIRGPHSTDLPERTILESSELDSLYRSITLNTTSTILAKKEASVLRKPPTPSPRRIHHLPLRHTQLASPYRC